MKKVFTFLLALSSLMFIVNCASPQPQKKFYWTHRYKTPQIFHADRAECLVMANTQPQANYPSHPISGGFAGGFAYGMNIAAAKEAKRARESIFSSCMQGKGWYLQEQ